MSTIEHRQDAIDAAVDALAQSPWKGGVNWTGWLCYLLESLDEQIDEAEYEVFLEALAERIAMRQQKGNWM